MRKISCSLIVIQFLGLVVATGLSIIQIETIQFSGPLLSAVGLVIAFVSFTRNRPCGLCFGLGVPTASVFCFFLIGGFDLDPYHAREPMFYILLGVILFHVGAGDLAIREIVAENDDNGDRLPFQFSIMSLLVLMFLVSLFFGLYKTFGKAGAALGAQIAYIVIVVYWVRQFRTVRSRRKEEDVDKGLPLSHR
jgi:hypothetical protein